MPYCTKCGAQVADTEKFCHACGTAVQSAKPLFIDTTNDFDPTDIKHNKALAMQAYLGILLLFPIFGGKHSPFTRYHANQGLLLIIANTAYGFAAGFTISLFDLIHPLLGLIMGILLSMVSLVFTAYCVWGIVNVLRGKAKTLSLIEKFKIIK